MRRIHMVFTIKVVCDKAACGMRKAIEWKKKEFHYTYFVSLCR